MGYTLLKRIGYYKARTHCLFHRETLHEHDGNNLLSKTYLQNKYALMNYYIKYGSRLGVLRIDFFSSNHFFILQKGNINIRSFKNRS